VCQFTTSLKITCIVGAAIFALLACSKSSDDAGQEPDTLIVAEGSQPIAAPIYVADHLDLWSKYGLKVELVSFTSGRACLDSVVAGRADIGTVAETPIVRAVILGLPVRILGTIHYSSSNTSGVGNLSRIENPKDLAHKRVGVSVGTNGEFFLDQFLKAHDLEADSVEVINVRPEDMAATLSSGGVDAVFTWEPNLTAARRALGQNALELPNEGIYTETYNVVTMTAVENLRRDALDRFMRALDEASAYIRNNRQQAISVVASRLGMKRSTLESLWDNFVFNGAPDSFMETLSSQTAWVSDGEQSSIDWTKVISPINSREGL
jgi:ABC-type nitrate/sulfonate/bicarbonate transport system substrate-binding protein